MLGDLVDLVVCFQHFQRIHNQQQLGHFHELKYQYLIPGHLLFLYCSQILIQFNIFYNHSWANQGGITVTINFYN